MLDEIEREGLFHIIEQGKFAGVKRPVDGGKGLEGVFTKDEKYFNPFIELMVGGVR
jgi:beta-lysine 5,6-aminomutase alpha subunit